MFSSVKFLWLDIGGSSQVAYHVRNDYPQTYTADNNQTEDNHPSKVVTPLIHVTRPYLLTMIFSPQHWGGGGGGGNG